MDLSKYGSIINVLECSWANAVSSFWKKYPNQHSQHVLTEDVLERKLFSDGRLYTRRLLRKTNPLPSWGTMIFSSHLTKIAHVIEESIVDPLQQTMTVYSWNTTYTNMMDVHERLTITPMEARTTQLFKEGWVDSSLTGFRRVLRQFGLSRWKSNARKAFLGYQSVLLQLGVTGASHNRVLGEKTLDSLQDVKHKAKKKAIDFAVIANTRGVQS